MKAALISYDDVREVDLKTNSAGSAYAAIRSAVEGGFVEPFNALYGASITLYVNDNGIAEGQQPNRAVYANERMQEMRYLSMMAPASFKAVRKGDLYTVLFGPIVAVGYNPDTGADRDLEPEELETVMRDFGDGAPMGPGSGLEALLLRRLADSLASM
ncbi:MAG: DUF3846 domain-containing protein [Senegalimassilia anaerobia]|uniref:DUF3846 domain-containing protein n=1 Tax=Senegalimassilia anaerobia TaxID=1473216 RepID=UPI002E781A06|nr:DUF3846 domain-containing protein [Senegalimassilia anaerobia]MEE0304319.1 DUF3846 domain-containing protein [Senegalimassilia anaerobia]